MPTRRTAISLVGATALLAASPWPVRRAWAQADTQAVAFIKTITDQLVAIVNNPGTPQEKRARLKAVLDKTVDHDEIARFCLGRFWQIATPDQQKQYMALFQDLLVAEIAGHLGEYQGVAVTMGLARAFKATEIVITTVARPGAPSMRVDWVVSTTSGNPKIVDLIGEGTSMRITQAADFTAFLANSQYTIQNLLDGMRQKAAQGQ